MRIRKRPAEYLGAARSRARTAEGSGEANPALRPTFVTVAIFEHATLTTTSLERALGPGFQIRGGETLSVDIVVTAPDQSRVRELRRAHPRSWLLVAADDHVRAAMPEPARFLDIGADAYVDCSDVRIVAAHVRALARRADKRTIDPC